MPMPMPLYEPEPLMWTVEVTHADGVTFLMHSPWVGEGLTRAEAVALAAVQNAHPEVIHARVRREDDVLTDPAYTRNL